MEDDRGICGVSQIASKYVAMGAYNDIDIEERPVLYENEIGGNVLVNLVE